jgi:outer membrane protein assembly factor BamB
MDDLQGGVRLKKPATLTPDSSASIVLEYVNRDGEAFHHLKNVSVWPTWNPDREIANGSDFLLLPDDSKRLLAATVDTPPGLGGRQGFHVEFEVGLPSKSGEMAYRHTDTLLAVPVSGTVQYDAVLCTAGAGEPDRSVRDFIQNWGFDIYLASGEREVRERFTEFTDPPTCFVGVLPANGGEQGRQAVSSAASVALSRDVPAVVLVEDTATYPHLPENEACFVIKCDIESQRALARHSGPELLGVRRSIEAGTTNELLKRVRERVEQEPKEFLRALVYSVLLEWTGATEVLLESVEDTTDLFVTSVAGNVTEPDTSTWPTFQGTTARTGHHPTASGPQTDASVKWAFQTGGWVFSSPAVVDGDVYVGSRDENVYALDAATGREQWIFQTQGAVSSSPAVADGTVYVGGGVDENVYALDAATGRQQWAFEADRPVESSPAVADGTVYIGCVNMVYALDAATGREQWVFQTQGAVTAGLAVADGTVYVGSRCGNIYALDATTGREQWTFRTTHGGVRSSPAVVDSTVYVGSRNYGDGNVHALDAATGRQQWAFQADDDVQSSPAVVDGAVYVGSHDGNVYALDAATGREQWIFQTQGAVSSSPAVADGTVYVGSRDENVYALDAATGRQQWGFQVDHWVHSSPAVADGTVYVGSKDRNMYALEASRY